MPAEAKGDAVEGSASLSGKIAEDGWRSPDIERPHGKSRLWQCSNVGPRPTTATYALRLPQASCGWWHTGSNDHLWPDTHSDDVSWGHLDGDPQQIYGLAGVGEKRFTHRPIYVGTTKRRWIPSEAVWADRQSTFETEFLASSTRFQARGASSWRCHRETSIASGR